MIENHYGSKADFKEIRKTAPMAFKPVWGFYDYRSRVSGREISEEKRKSLEKRQLRYLTARETRLWLRKNYRDDKIKLFSSVEIETINRCNGTCSFCPVNRNDEVRKFARMDEELFHRIIDQLHDLDYRGRVALHSNNEPFLDVRIIDFAKYAREKLPGAFLYLYTNGTLTTLEKYLEIMRYLDKIYIDNYSDELELSANAAAIQQYCSRHKNYDKKTVIYMRKIHEVLYTRGGQSPNNRKKETLHFSCILPFKQMVIRPDGKCSLCCNDPLGKNTMGDVNKDSLEKIWRNDRYRRVRRALARGGRRCVSLCRYCDTLADVSAY